MFSRVDIMSQAVSYSSWPKQTNLPKEIQQIFLNEILSRILVIGFNKHFSEVSVVIDVGPSSYKC